MNWRLVAILLCILIYSGCLKKQKESVQETTSVKGKGLTKIQISSEVYRDKVLGLLLGSAIGDAMGAPTEMWDRNSIQMDYGFVDGLDSMIRNPSAEGIWKYNMPAGSTTDDTRWKVLIGEFLLGRSRSNVGPREFANYVVKTYEEKILELKRTEGFAPEPYEENLMKMSWLQEWAMVARPYAEDDLQAFNDALHKFYGGEMTCAGMLYSPMLGIVAPGDPEAAYRKAYELSIFDIGYARDMTALVSAMTSLSFDSDAGPDQILAVNRNVDPYDYFKSRLVGRSAYRFYQHAKNIVNESKSITLEEQEEFPGLPEAYHNLDSLQYLQLATAYEMLDEANEDLAFHPGEIYLIALTAMMFHEFDFEDTMSFIVNYGRDNDTVAAIAGAILGAYWGANQLPEEMTSKVLKVNKEELNLDLTTLADQMTDWFFHE